MLNIINEVEKCLGNELYVAALTLALTIPDICGKIAYSAPQKRKGDKYISWFDKYVYSNWNTLDYEKVKKIFLDDIYDQYDFEDGSEKLECAIKHVLKSIKINSFDGEKCYLLRCAVLHAGNTDFFRAYDFELSMGGYIFQSEHRGSDDSSGSHMTKLSINVIWLCESIIKSAQQYYESIEDKTKFDNYSFEIVKK